MREKRIIIASAIALCISISAGAQNIDRGYFNKSRNAMVFAPKGSWFLGGSAEYSIHENDRLSFSALKDFDSNGFKVSVSPSFGYIIKDNIAAGVRMNYARNNIDINSAAISVAGTELNWEDYYLLKHDFSAALFLRNYIPVDRAGRLALFVEMQLSGEGGQSKIHCLRDGNVVGTYSTVKGASLGVNAGGVVLLSKHFGLEASLNVLNAGFNSTAQSHNQVNAGSLKSSDFSYNIDVFSLKLGLYYYL